MDDVFNRSTHRFSAIPCVRKFDTNTSTLIPEIEKMFSSNIIGRILPQAANLIGVAPKLCLDWLGC